MPQYKLEENDFGFSFEDESFGALEQRVEVEASEKERWAENAWIWEWRCKQVIDKIAPLLQNLAANPDKEVIRWPNRREAVEKFERELKGILTKLPPDPEEQ